MKEGRIQWKAFADAKVKQLNHYVILFLEEFDYDCAIIHVGTKDILWSKDMSELKEIPEK